MARLLYADPGSHLVYQLAGRSVRSAAGMVGTLYEDAAGTVLADIAEFDPLNPGTPGPVIPSSQLTVNSNSLLPWFWGPAAGTDTLYVTVNGGPLTSINAYYDPRIDDLAAGSVPNTRQIIAGTGLTGGGDLSADRTLLANFGAIAGTVTQGNDPRLSDARTPTAHAASHLPGGSDALTTAIAGSSAVGDTPAVGVAAAFSRSDHQHGREAFGNVTAQTTFGAASANGSATTVSHSDHTHGTPAHGAAAHSAVSLSDLAAPTGSLSMGTQKITNLVNGASAQDAAAYGQIIPASIGDAKGDLITFTADNTPARLAAPADTLRWVADSSQSSGWRASDAIILDFPVSMLWLHMGTTASTTWVASNEARYVRVIGSGTISKIGFDVVAQSGNISVAAYRRTGTGTSAKPGTRLATSGSVACPAIGYAEVSLGASVTLYDGDYLAMSADNTTFQFRGNSGPSGNALSTVYAFGQATAHPLPSTPTVSTGAASRIPFLIGVA